jgi:hypothetical protein
MALAKQGKSAQALPVLNASFRNLLALCDAKRFGMQWQGFSVASWGHYSIMSDLLSTGQQLATTLQKQGHALEAVKRLSELLSMFSREFNTLCSSLSDTSTLCTKYTTRVMYAASLLLCWLPMHDLQEQQLRNNINIVSGKTDRHIPLE